LSERIGLADRIERAWTNRPLSAQLVVLITGLLAVGLTMSGTVMIGLLQRHLISQVDAQLTSDAALRLFNQTGAAASNGMASTVPTAYYLRLTVADRAGVLADITRILAENSISINSVSQKNHRKHNGHIPLVLLTEIVSEAQMNHACEQLAALPAVSGAVKRIRVENIE